MHLIDLLIFVAYIGGPILIGALVGTTIHLRALRNDSRHVGAIPCDLPNRHPNGGWQPKAPSGWTGKPPNPNPRTLRSAVTPAHKLNPIRLPR